MHNEGARLSEKVGLAPCFFLKKKRIHFKFKEKNKMQTKTAAQLKKLTGSALFLALALALPFLTGQIPEIGNALCPMHLPVLICGMLFGPLYGGVVGFIAPLLRFIIFSAPIIYPRGISMAFELLAYGVISGVLVKYLPKNIPALYASLIAAMLGGRIVWAGVMMFITLFGSVPFGFSIFIAEAFINALPGIILQIVVIPPIVLALKKAGLLLN